MKKFFIIWCAVLTLAILMGVCACAIAETYATTAVVVSLDYDADVVEVEDFNDNVWAFDGCEEWQVFDVCALVMNDYDTTIIYDDEIISVHYCGYLDGWMDLVRE